MFSLFSRKNMNEDAAKAFWVWFEEQEKWIIDYISTHDSAFILEKKNLFVMVKNLEK